MPPRRKNNRGNTSTTNDTKANHRTSTTNNNNSSKNKCFLEESSLYCEICLDILHNAVSVFPCNHKFCAGCIYEWDDQNHFCPKCRWRIHDITRDHFVNAIVDQYLATYPEKKRSQSCLDLLDERELHHLERYQNNDWAKHDEGEMDEDDDGDIFNETFELEEDEEVEDDEAEDEDTPEDDDDEDMWVDEGYERYAESEARRIINNARIERLRKEKEERDQRRAEAEKAQKASSRQGKRSSTNRSLVECRRSTRSNASSNPPSPSHSSLDEPIARRLRSTTRD